MIAYSLLALKCLHLLLTTFFHLKGGSETVEWSSTWSLAFTFCIHSFFFSCNSYCLDELPRTFDEFVNWVCEDCEDNVLSQHDVQNSEAIRHIPGKVGSPPCTNHTSKAILRTNKKCHESSLSHQFQEVSSEEIDSTLESKLGGDSSPIKVNLKRKHNGTNLVAVTDCSSHHSHDSHASIDCNEQSQSPSSLKLPKDMISIGFDEQFPKRRCSAHSKPTLVGDCLKVINVAAGGSSCISHKKEESKLAKETQLRVQTSIIGCNTSVSNKGNEPNISAHDDPKRGLPVIDIIWRCVKIIIFHIGRLRQQILSNADLNFYLYQLCLQG